MTKHVIILGRKAYVFKTLEDAQRVAADYYDKHNYRLEILDWPTYQRRKQAARRKAKEATLRSLGLTKVRGSLGGIYWE